MRKLFYSGLLAALSLSFTAGMIHAEDAPAAPAAQPAQAQPAQEQPAKTSSDVSAKADVQVDKIVVGSGLQDREVTGEGTEFAEGATVYCWNKVTAANPPATIHHVWYQDGKKIQDVPLTIKYPAARTWSYKQVTPGKWKVDVASESGSVIQSIDFSVGQSTAPQ